jgi:UDP-N-acetyl-D-glucosamine/UDP-N-acetyl-D-galactosamine dehydrogenase
MAEKFGILGLGYVGLPVAIAFAKKFPGTVGFDINEEKVSELAGGFDRTGETEEADLNATSLKFSCDENDLRECTFFVVAVPTPVDDDKRPDLTPVRKASETVGRVIQPGAVVVYESTVYPGVTEEVAGPIIEKISGLKCGVDFKLGYSPERINPGDKERTLEKIVKVVSGQDAETLDRVADAYAAIVPAGIHRAPTIKVAEASKVIENTQRDLNIALVNELALIFDRMGIRTRDVLEAAGTKWNFLKFWPGLVGGHCIGVDPYYLTTKAEQLGYHPYVIHAGRRINDQMGAFVAQKMVKMLIERGINVSHARVAVLGGTFKEDVADIRNSRVIDMVKELRSFGVQVMWHDAMADAEEVIHEYGAELCSWEEIGETHGLILAVPHRQYLSMSQEELFGRVQADGVLIDVKAALKREQIPPGLAVWSL